MTRDTKWDEQELRFVRETNQFLSVFPELVWHRIIENLDHNDLRNLISSSVFFRNLLHNKRIYIFFQDVIKIVISQCITESEAKSAVLNCRLVCKPWNRTVEDLAENEDIWETQHSKKTVSSIFQSIRTSYNFEPVEKLGIFLQKFEELDIDINPFLGRTIKFSSHVYFYWSPLFCGEVIPFLEQYGHHIWFCTFHFKIIGQMESEVVFRNAIKTLYLMPSLKKLRLEYDDRFTFAPGPALCAPMLPNLEILEFSFVPTPFCDVIIAPNVHINKLVLVMSQASLVNPFQNLRELEHYECNMEEIDRLKNYNGLFWPLRKLTLRFDVKVDWAELLDFFSTKCAEKLEELVLSTYHEVTKRPEEDKLRTDCQIGRLNCSNLKKMKLCTANYSSFNFLLGTAESLEHLNIEWKIKKTKNSNKRFQYITSEIDLNDVHILDYREELCSSNIWNLFPKLKTVILDGYDMKSKQIYKRNEWKFQKNQITY